MAAGFEVFQGRDSLWYWRYRAENGEIIAASEGYTRKFDAERATENATDQLGGVRFAEEDVDDGAADHG